MEQKSRIVGRTVRYQPLFQPESWVYANVERVEIGDPRYGIMLCLDNGNRRPISQVVFDGDLDPA